MHVRNKQFISKDVGEISQKGNNNNSHTLIIITN